MLARAASVRSVTSSTGKPPASRARASGTASAASSNTITGITGAAETTSSISIARAPFGARSSHRHRSDHRYGTLGRGEDDSALLGPGGQRPCAGKQLAAEAMMVALQVRRRHRPPRPLAGLDPSLQHTAFRVEPDRV